MTNWLVLALSLAVSSVGFARALTETEKLSDLDQLVALIRSGYGPLQYKEKQGIHLEELRASYAEKVKQTKTNEEFYYLIERFIPEFRDSHFGAEIPNEMWAILPIATDLVEGKVLVETSDGSTSIVRGDEVVQFDGRDVGLILDDLQATVNAGFVGFARRAAALRLTARSGRAVPVPTGDVMVTVRHASGDLETVNLTWMTGGRNIIDLPDNLRPLTSAAHLARSRDFDQLSMFDYWGDFLLNKRNGPHAERSYMCSGSTRIAIPTDATILMTEPFVAYYHPTAKGNVGYLRIPHYFWTSEDGKTDNYDTVFAQYEYAIGQLEKNTVGLIIDQDHNCGGSVDFVHRMVSLLVSSQFKPADFQLLANRREYMEFRTWVDETPENTLARVGLEQTLELIKQAWLAGDFMTPKTSIDGAQWFQPNPIHYTKPIVMLIDEMSGSGGDMFPSMVQGIGRAKLLGTRTMGAGGHVVEQPPLYFSQIGVRMTKSLFYRPDGVAVENNGAVPDYPYTITRADYVNGYRGYQAYYLQKLMELLP